jgi:hypothetical protein
MSVMVSSVSSQLRDVLRDLIARYARHDPPRTISIVGNAPQDVSPARVALIDSADLVVRMTSFALDAPGAPPRVGRRTDVVMLHRAVVAGPGTFADHLSRLYLLVEPGRLHWEREDRPPWWPSGVDALSVPNREFTCPLIDLLGLDAAEPVWPTTGTLSAYLFSELFPTARLRLHGTSIVDTPGQTRFDHHWGAAVGVTAEHRLHAEAALLRGWHDDGRIELVA